LLLSNADTLDSAKGWAAGIRFNERVISQFQAFYGRQDTWSLGICNGCQLMALLGWVPASGAPTDRPHGVLPDLDQPRFVHNKSGRFESRWAGEAVGGSAVVVAAVVVQLWADLLTLDS
jgi:phosphoribosylformylglycinamidine synthase